jgi:L-ascorbate metabolism protein UlaG (beta-lactamase superfamily)
VPALLEQHFVNFILPASGNNKEKSMRSNKTFGSVLDSLPVSTASARNGSKLAVAAIAFMALAVATSSLFAAPVPVQVFKTAAGPVEITPIFHASVMIKAGNDTIYIDPAPPANIAGLHAAGLILITDIHPDHLNMADITALSGPKTEIVAPAAAKETVKAAKVIANGESTQWHGWKITAVPMYNIKHTMPNGQPFHPKGRGNGYVLTYGGKSFYFAGDTEGIPEMRALKNIEVAFIPMNLPYTMTPAEAADAVKAFKPKVVIPYHYRGQDLQIFANALKGTGIEVRILDWYGNPDPNAPAMPGPPPHQP